VATRPAERRFWERIPAACRRALQRAASTTVGELAVLTAPSAAALDREPLWRDPAAAGLVAWGVAPNGDLWVYDVTASGPHVGLLSHDLVWEGQGPHREAFAPVAGTVAEVLRSAAAGTAPIDFWEARDAAKG